jgi:hypothetical protein
MVHGIVVPQRRVRAEGVAPALAAAQLEGRGRRGCRYGHGARYVARDAPVKRFADARL